jgi:hypothetical protein
LEERTVKKRREKQEEKICILKVTLSDVFGRIRGTPHRILAIPERFTLYGLAEEIVDAFDFDFDHCFGFFDNLKLWTESNECYELFKDIEKEQGLEPTYCKSVKKTRVGGVFNEIGKKMLFLFDYGDEWRFIVELKGIELPKQDTNYPLILESIGNAPPQYGEIDED